MSDVKHTAEPWGPGTEVFISAKAWEDIGHSFVFPHGHSKDIFYANARRIVAAVNACAAISTERLEMALPGQMKTSLDSLCAEIEELTSQRDQLLEALMEAREALAFANDTPCGPIIDTIWMMHRPGTLLDHLDAAIAAVKDGA